MRTMEHEYERRITQIQLENQKDNAQLQGRIQFLEDTVEKLYNIVVPK